MIRPIALAKRSHLRHLATVPGARAANPGRRRDFAALLLQDIAITSWSALPNRDGGVLPLARQRAGVGSGWQRVSRELHIPQARWGLAKVVASVRPGGCQDDVFY